MKINKRTIDKAINFLETIPLQSTVLLLILSSCAADPVNVSECVTGKADGFWMGLWHGQNKNL